eukprot:737263_1
MGAFFIGGCKPKCTIRNADLQGKAYLFDQNCNISDGGRAMPAINCTVSCARGYHSESGLSPEAVCMGNGQFWLSGCIANQCSSLPRTAYKPCFGPFCSGECAEGFGDLNA